MSPPQATIDALGCHVKGPGSGTAGRETNHVFRNRTTSEMQLQIADRATSVAGDSERHITYKTRTCGVSVVCIFAPGSSSRQTRFRSLRAAPAQAPMAWHASAQESAHACQGLRRSQPSRTDAHGMDMASLSHSLTQTVTHGTLPTRKDRWRREWATAATTAPQLACCTDVSRTGAAPFLPPPPRPCPELLDAPRLMTASRAEPHARDRTEWGRGGHVLPLPLGA